MLHKPTPQLSQKQLDRFYFYIDKCGDDDCWPWIGARDPNYGSFRIGSSQYRAHRVMYKLHYGADPSDLEVCHTCDNPPCVNPSHLFPGTQFDNIQDCIAKGRKPIGDANVLSKLTDEQVETILISEESNTLLAERFGVSHSLIHRIRAGLARPNAVTPRPQHDFIARGSRSGRTALTNDDIRFIRESSATNQALGTKFNLNPSTVSKIKLRKRWAHI